MPTANPGFDQLFQNIIAGNLKKKYPGALNLNEQDQQEPSPDTMNRLAGTFPDTLKPEQQEEYGVQPQRQQTMQLTPEPVQQGPSPVQNLGLNLSLTPETSGAAPLPPTFRDQAVQEQGGPKYARRNWKQVLGDIAGGALKGVATGRGLVGGAAAGGMGLYRQADLDDRIDQRTKDLEGQEKGFDADLDRKLKEETLASVSQNRLAGQGLRQQGLDIKQQAVDNANQFHNDILGPLLQAKTGNVDAKTKDIFTGRALQILKNPDITAEAHNKTVADMKALGYDVEGYGPDVKLTPITDKSTGHMSSYNTHTGMVKEIIDQKGKLFGGLTPSKSGSGGNKRIPSNGKYRGTESTKNILGVVTGKFDKYEMPDGTIKRVPVGVSK